MIRNPKSYEIKKPGWCPGCGDFAVFAAIKRALSEKGFDPANVVVVSGIGCSGKLGDYIRTYAIHTLHGRVLPVATGIKLANPALCVIAAGGDGDGYAIGMGHFIHAARRNCSILYIVMNNQVYGLTKGQVSPTAERGFVTKSSPYGSFDEKIDGTLLAVSAGATFVARAFSGDIEGLSTIIKKALDHKGFALVEALSPCITFNRINTYDWFKENIYNVNKDNNYDFNNKSHALLALATGGKIPVGLLYKEEKEPFEERLHFEINNPTENITLNIDEIKKILNNYR